MIGAVKSIAKVIFDAVKYKFNAGDISFSLWDIVMTFLICALVGYLLYLFIVRIAEDDN